MLIYLHNTIKYDIILLTDKSYRTSTYFFHKARCKRCMAEIEIRYHPRILSIVIAVLILSFTITFAVIFREVPLLQEEIKYIISVDYNTAYLPPDTDGERQSHMYRLEEYDLLNGAEHKDDALLTWLSDCRVRRTLTKHHGLSENSVEFLMYIHAGNTVITVVLGDESYCVYNDYRWVISDARARRDELISLLEIDKLDF